MLAVRTYNAMEDPVTYIGFEHFGIACKHITNLSGREFSSFHRGSYFKIGSIELRCRCFHPRIDLRRRSFNPYRSGNL